MSDVSPYGTHQHAAPGAVRAHELVGDPVDHPTVNQVGASSSQATFSTQPYGGYKKEKPRRPSTVKHRVCSRCKQWALTGSDYCRWHQDEPADAS